MTTLERALREAAGGFELPPTPDVAAAVRGKLPARPEPVRRARALAAAAVAAAAVALLFAFSADARSALLDWLDAIPGVHIERVDALPATPFRGYPAYASERSLAEARGIVDFALVLPASEGAPDHVFVDGVGPESGIVTFLWGDLRKARLVLSEARGSRLVFHKLVPLGTHLQHVSVGGAPGAWIEGGEHIVFYVNRGGEVSSTGHLAGNTLVWARGGIVYRIELGGTLRQALRVAGSIRR